MRSIRRMVGPAVLIAGVTALVSTSAVAQQRERPTGQQAGGAGESVDFKRATQKRFTAAQMANVQERIATANRILDRLGNEATQQGGNLSIWRKSNMELLYALSLPALQSVERNANSLESLATAVREAANDPNLIGDPNADLVYTPINPCRYIDTRGGAIVSPATPRAYDLFFNGSAYGGSAGCTVLENVAAAIAVNVTIDQAQAGPAFLAIKPTLAAPTTSFMNWTAAGTQLANAGVVTLDQSGADPEFFILVSSPTHVLVDIFGFFAEPQATALQITNPTTNWSITSGSFSVTVACPAGYTITGGGWNHNVGHFDGVSATQSSAEGNSWRCRGWFTGPAGSTQAGTCEAVCARIPGR
jgi:hypothetical protein